MRAVVVIAITLAAGCNFRLPAPAAGDDGGPGSEQPGDGGACGWPYAPEYYDPCALGTAGPALDLMIVGQYTYDTTTGILTDPFLVTSIPPSTDSAAFRQIYAAEFSVSAQSKLRVIGTKPLLVVSDTTITVDGVIDARSFFSSLTITFDLGAGANPADCPSSPPDAGQTCDQEAGSGGGGGGYGAAGGSGGEGGDTHDCGGVDGIPGGAGGAPAASFTTLRGGCAGRNGAPSLQPGSDQKIGLGGQGGGAFYLSARTMVTVSGAANAGGAGGLGGLGGRAGGGGGGTGGMIGLEAETVIVTSSGVLSANGGGGGGGCDANIASSGDDAKPDATVAKGGKHEGGGGDGGDGGFLDTPDGQPGKLGTRGGGGGGGGAGVVHFHARGLTTTGATISPAPAP